MSLLSKISKPRRRTPSFRPSLEGSGLERRDLLASLAISGPDRIEVARTGAFQVTLDAPLGRHVTVQLDDGGRGGNFGSSSVTIAAGQRSASFTYSPSLYGRTTIAAADAAGGAGPAQFQTLAMVQLGSVNSLNGAAPDLGGWRAFAPDDPWNQDISRAAVHPESAKFLSVIGTAPRLNVSYDTVWYGMPFVVVPGTQPYVPLDYIGGYPQMGTQPSLFPIPDDIPIEMRPTGELSPRSLIDGDEHGIVLERDEATGGIKKIHEFFELYRPGGPGTNWAVNFLGVTWDATETATYLQRPDGYGSADAAGLNIFAGMVRADEVLKRGEIDHALRITLNRTTMAHIAPALAQAGNSTNPYAAPMGLRLRLRADFDASGMNPASQVIVAALKKYGAIVADNGPDLQLTGTRDKNWGSYTLLNALTQIRATDFEVLDFQPGFSVTPPASTSGPAGAASGQFRVALNAPTSNVLPTKAVTIEMSDDAGGTFSPSTLYISNTHPTATFTYTPSGAAGARTIRFREFGTGRVVPAPIPFTVTNQTTSAPPSQGATHQFDFGTATSPVASGYTAITHATAYSAGRGHGWQVLPVGSGDRWVGDGVTRDLVFGRDATFAADLAGGTYDVDLWLGDTGSWAHDQMGVYLEGQHVDTVSTAAGQVVKKTYRVTVSDGQLNLRLRDLGGSDPNWTINGLAIRPVVVQQARAYDFGTATSAVESGFTRVTHSTTFSASTGIGWLTAPVGSVDRGVGSGLARDLVFGRDATFGVVVPNGTYDVELWLGDLGQWAHDQMGVYLEGQHVDTVSTAAGQVVARTYRVTVADGRLDLRLRDLGGSDPNWTINGLRLRRV